MNWADGRQKAKVAAVARKYRLSYIRLFGSALRSIAKGRDLDLVIARVGNRPILAAERSNLSDLLGDIFKKPVDLLELHRDMNPVLVHEIGAKSQPLWQHPKHGLVDYIEKIEPMLAIAQDELLAFPTELRDVALKQVTRALRVA